MKSTLSDLVLTLTAILTPALVFGSVIASAAPVELSGRFVPTGEAHALGRVTVDVVDTRLDASADQLKGLRAAGAECVAVGATIYRCVSHVAAAGVPTVSLDRAIAKTAPFWIELGETWSPAALVNDSEDLKEWTVGQRGTWMNGRFDTYRYLELAGGFAKIVLSTGSDSSTDLWLNVDSARGGLAKFETIVTTESRWRFHEDSIEVVLGKRQ